MGNRPGKGSQAVRRDGVRGLLGRRIRMLLRRRRQARIEPTPEAIHDVRVATRRLQEALEVFATALPTRERERLRRRARGIRRSLAEIRDADVLLELVRRLRARPGGWTAPGIAALERRLQARVGRLRGGLRSTRGAGESGKHLRIRGIRKRARALLRAAGAAPDGHLAARAARIAGSRAREVRAAQRRAASGRAADMHRLRIAIKRHRYCLETLEAWGIPELEEGIARARDLQDRLGAIHDLDVLIDLVRATPAVSVLRDLRSERRRLSAAARPWIGGFRPLLPRRGPAAARRSPVREGRTP